MVGFRRPTGGPTKRSGGGVHLDCWDEFFVMDAATGSRGDVLQWDFLGQGAGTTTFDHESTGNYARAIVPLAATVDGTNPANMVVALSDWTTAGEVVECRIFGEVDAFVIAATGSIVLFDKLVATVARNFDLVTATGEVFYALAAEAVGTPTTRTLARVFLDNGFVLLKEQEVA